MPNIKLPSYNASAYTLPGLYNPTATAALSSQIDALTGPTGAVTLPGVTSTAPALSGKKSLVVLALLAGAAYFYFKRKH